jgi:hypothetical protein
MKRVKIEICDNNGELVTVAMSGQVSKERLMQILDVFEIHDGSINTACQSPKTKTSKEKLLDVIRSQLSKVWFTSKDLSLLYIERYHETIKSSTVSTYLTRLYTNGYLERNGNRACWQYRLVVPVNKERAEIRGLVEDLRKK